MASNIKGITVEIGGDTTGLSKALKEMNTDINSTQKELKEVEKLLKLDPSNTELLAQKQKLLATQIENTKNKVSVLKDAQKQADNEIKNGTEVSEAQYRKLQREIANAEIQTKSLEEQSEKRCRRTRYILPVMHSAEKAVCLIRCPLKQQKGLYR